MAATTQSLLELFGCGAMLYESTDASLEPPYKSIWLSLVKKQYPSRTRDGDVVEHNGFQDTRMKNNRSADEMTKLLSPLRDQEWSRAIYSEDDRAVSR